MACKPDVHIRCLCVFLCIFAGSVIGTELVTLGENTRWKKHTRTFLKLIIRYQPMCDLTFTSLSLEQLHNNESRVTREV